MKQRRMPNGSTLFWEINEVGCRRYWSDAVGGGVMVWDTALVDRGTLNFAMAVEDGLQLAEQTRKRRKAGKS